MTFPLRYPILNRNLVNLPNLYTCSCSPSVGSGIVRPLILGLVEAGLSDMQNSAGVRDECAGAKG